MNELYSYKLLSHPNKLLIDHLREVGNSAKTVMLSKTIFVPENIKLIIEWTAYVIGACHDFGKATQFFQNYITCEDEHQKKLLKNKPQTHHGLLSAIFTYYVLKSTIIDNENIVFALFGFLAVKRHHGNLRNIKDEFVELRETKKIIVIQDQIQAINLEIINIYTELIPKISLNEFFQEILTIITDIKNTGKLFSNNIRSQHSLENYLLFQNLYSCLLMADKTDAAELQLPRRQILDYNMVEKYFRIKNWDKPQSKIDKIRLNIYHESLNKIQSLDLNSQRIFSLNVPTGTGKTLISLALALKLREKITQSYHYEPRIIYTLPFLSIIDQNSSVFDDVFTQTTGNNPNTDLLLKHHHLAESIYNTEDTEYTGKDGHFFIEGWHSELIVTTFVQLFHSLLTNKNKSIRKFNNIFNSILILDEVQTLPHEYWLLFRDMINFLSKIAGVFTIFVTATQPFIFNVKNNEIIDLIINKETYFRNFNRFQFYYHSNVLAIEEFKSILKNMINNNPEKHFLIVLNTISCAKEIYQSIKELQIEKTTLYYLSTHIIPKDRLNRIKLIKKDTTRKIIVSTQLVEAGVDIDVDVVIRDFAPLDAINQVAGRCNRHNSREYGEVHVFILKDLKNEYYKYIYSGFLISKTKDVLDQISNSIPESDFFSLTQQYFEKVSNYHSEDEAEQILSQLQSLQFSYLQEKFKLIKDGTYEKIDVFIEVDETAANLWQKFLSLQTIKNQIEKKNTFLIFRNEFYGYIISVPKEKAPPIENNTFLRKINMGLAYVSQTELHLHYNRDTTGYIYQNGGIMIF